MSHPDTPPSDPAVRPHADLLLARLLEVTEHLAGAGNEEEVAGAVLLPGVEALGARAGAVMLVREGGLRVVASRGREETGGWPDGSLNAGTPAADALARREPLFSGHGAAGACAALPMVLDGGPLGVLVFEFPGPHPFTPEEERFLRILASQAALALGRSRAVRELRESHDRLVLTLQAGDFGLWEWDPETGLLRRDPQTARLLGSAPEVAPLGDFLSRIHPEDRARVETAFGRARQAGGPASFVVEHRLTRGDGREVWTEQHTRVERDAQGRAVRFLGVTADITARKEAQEERARLARLVEESTDFIGIAGLDGRAVYVNAAGRRLLGIGEPGEVDTLHALEVFPPEDRPFVQEVILPRTLEEGRWEGDFRFRHLGTGEIIDVAYNMFALTDPGSGRPVALATVTRDVRVRKRQERELHVLNRDLERRVAERTRRLEEEARAREAFVAFTEAVGTETDVPALVRQAIEVLHVHFPEGSVGYYEREGERWKGRLGSGNSPEAFNRAVAAGLPGDTPVIARMLREGEAVFVDGWDAAAGGVAGSEVYGTVACYPLAGHGGVESFLGVALRNARAWRERDRALVRAVGRGLNLALERARQAREIGEWRRRYEVAVQGSGHLLYDWDPATDLIVYGGAAEHITGYTPQELAGNLGDWTGRLIHPEDRAAFRREIARVVGTGDGFYLAFRIVRKDGEVREVEDDGYFMRDPQGRLTRMVGFVRDVTERNRAEADRARLARVVEESADSIEIADPSGRVTYLNAAGRALVGLAPDADPGTILDNVHENDRERFETAILPLVDRVGRWRGDVTLRHLGTGEAIATNRTVFTLTDPATGRPGGYATVTRDVRRRRAAEEALRRANLELQRSNAELEQFAYVASHDLQEPLRTVTSFAGLLARRYGGQLDPKAEVYLRLITEGTARMSRLLDDLLAFARVSSAARPAAPVDTGQVVAQVMQDLHAGIEGTRARVEVGGELPGVMGDSSQLRQLFQNLLGNALKFRHPARAPLVRVEARVEGAVARFSVRDNGIGIPPEFHERIFTIFQRLHTRETYEGSGIGLAIARKIVERHGGRLWLESVPGEGTTFLLTLPLAPGGEG